MARFVRSLSGQQWLNLDTIDAITVMGQGSRFLVVAERHTAPNAILSTHADEQRALEWVQDLIGETA